MSNKILKCVQQAEDTIALIKGNRDAERVHDLFRQHPDQFTEVEPDYGDDQYRTEDELISDQEDLMDGEPEEEDDDEGYRPLSHTMDGHSSGSFVFTGVGFGIDKQRTTLTRFTGKRKTR